MRRFALFLLVVSSVGLAMADERSERGERNSHTFRDHDKHKQHVTAVPEPGNLLLLGTGLLAAWAALKQRELA